MARNGNERQNRERARNPFSVFSAANRIQKRRYNMYRQAVETSNGKNVPLSYEQWKAAGMPTE